MKNIQMELKIPENCSGTRLDQCLSNLIPDHSRARIQTWIRDQHVKVDGTCKKPRDKVQGGEQIIINAPLPDSPDWQAEAFDLDIIFEDSECLIINKPPGLVVHPGTGNEHGTLINAVLSHAPTCSHVPRAGVVHRIDKDTSGLLVVAKTPSAHTFFVDQLQKRLIKREYICLVYDTMTAGGTIDAPIGRHPHKRTQMAVRENGKPAITHYRIRERFKEHTLLNVQLETGRTHQIRVHMSYLRHPIVGDRTYGGKPRFPKNASPKLMATLHAFKRQALHAARLTLTHPISKETMVFEVPLAADINNLCDILKIHDKKQV